jgi:hypothetical protein
LFGEWQTSADGGEMKAHQNLILFFSLFFHRFSQCDCKLRKCPNFLGKVPIQCCQKSGRKPGRNFFFQKSFHGRKSGVNRHRSRSAETVTICVSQKWCRILPRGISTVCIVLVVFLRFLYRKPET